MNTASMLVERDKKVLVGTGQHKRLTAKRHPLELQFANEVYSKLMHSFRHFGNPKLFVLVKPACSYETGIQEYFEKPSVAELINFLEAKKSHSPSSYLKRKQALICKRFTNHPLNKGISLEKLRAALDELKDSCAKVSLGKLFGHNIIVLGQNMDGKIRLALIDV